MFHLGPKQRYGSLLLVTGLNLTSSLISRNRQFVCARTEKPALIQTATVTSFHMVSQNNQWGNQLSRILMAY